MPAIEAPRTVSVLPDVTSVWSIAVRPLKPMEHGSAAAKQPIWSVESNLSQQRPLPAVPGQVGPAATKVRVEWIRTKLPTIWRLTWLVVVLPTSTSTLYVGVVPVPYMCKLYTRPSVATNAGFGGSIVAGKLLRPLMHCESPSAAAGIKQIPELLTT